MAASNSSSTHGPYGNSSKQLWKEWGAGYAGKSKENDIGLSEKDSLKDGELDG